MFHTRPARRVFRTTARVLAGAALASMASLGCQDRRGPSTNVVLIIADTLRADVLGCYGDDAGASPELDALAARSVRFERVIAPSPWTKPSIAALITGQHPRTIGVYDEEGDSVPRVATTLAECFRKAGYLTVGVTANPMINSTFGFDQGFDHYGDSVSPDALQSPSFGRLPPARTVFETALNLVRNHRERGQPVFLLLDVMEMHEHWRGPAALTRGEYRKLFQDRGYPPYYQALRQVSADVREFLDALLAMEGFEDTLVVFTSDHGEGLQSHPGVPESQLHGTTLYESMVRVPLIVHHTGGRFEPRVVTRPVRLIDVPPTLLDVAGVPGMEHVEGKSLRPLLLEGDAGEVDLPEAFFTETYYRDYEKKGVYADGFALLRHLDGHQGMGARELQAWGGGERGLSTDRSAERPDVVRRLSQLLDRFEARHPKAPASRSGRPMPPEMERLLREIGYMAGRAEEDDPEGSRR